MRNTTILRRGIAAIAALALAGSLASCAQSQRETGTTTEEGSGGGDFVFAGSSDPAMLDPALASEGETFRIARQQFEGLVSTKPGTTELEP
ncbi:MAG TPA: ABC transporter substrate-binding protein, partial [Microlunatus sp.]